MKDIATPVCNELETILAGAEKISQKLNFTEMCTEVVLYALLENNQLPVFQHLQTLGANTIGMKLTLAKLLNGKAQVTPPPVLTHSNALAGLLFINGMSCKTGVHLLKTILKNRNTAAFRMLNQSGVTLDKNGFIIYSPINN